MKQCGSFTKKKNLMDQREQDPDERELEIWTEENVWSPIWTLCWRCII